MFCCRIVFIFKLGAKILSFLVTDIEWILFLRIFIKKLAKNLPVLKKVVPLHPQNGNVSECSMELGYGVMVTLQILVLPFLVRVRVPQQRASKIRKLFFVYTKLGEMTKKH